MSYVLAKADARRVPLADKTVQCVVTSPPYFGLRDYGSDGQIGLEGSPDAYVAEMVKVFREVWRVLRDDGVVFLNIGDSYARGFGGGTPGDKSATNVGSFVDREIGKVPAGFKSKDRLGIPHRLVFALQADGWYWRDEIIWHKPAPMPESVTDRTTKAHEFVFLLSKSERYFYDAEAIKEPSTQPDRAGTVENTFHSASREGAGRNDVGRSVLRTEFRNCRSVWTINTQPFKGSHFATMPPMLAERCIKAGTSERGCCPSCRAPWVRSVEKDRQATRPGADTKVAGLDGMTIGNRDPRRHTTTTKTTGWNPACVCDAGEPVPCLTFDPFNGAGTTGAVATGLGRDYAGTDLSTEYLAMADRRISRPHAPIAPASRDIPMPLFA